MYSTHSGAGTTVCSSIGGVTASKTTRGGTAGGPGQGYLPQKIDEITAAQNQVNKLFDRFKKNVDEEIRIIN